MFKKSKKGYLHPAHRTLKLLHPNSLFRYTKTLIVAVVQLVRSHLIYGYTTDPTFVMEAPDPLQRREH
jgi:hypothetical protein